MAQQRRLQYVRRIAAHQLRPSGPSSVTAGLGQFSPFLDRRSKGGWAPFAAVPADHRRPGGSLRSGLSGLVTASDLLAAGLRQRHPLQERVA